jgi:protein-disulfide isomerase
MLPGIRQDVSDGVALRIGSTPTYFVNGVRLAGNLQPQYFKLAIEHELKKAGVQ